MKFLKKLFITVSIVLLIIICIGFTLIAIKHNEITDDNKNINNSESTSTTNINKNPLDKTGQETKAATKNNNDIEYESEKATILTHEESGELEETTLDIDKIAGFIPESKYNSNADSHSDNIDKNRIVLSVQDITADAVGAYSGNYIEDGSDEPIKNVASLIVTNHSDKMLQVADIEFKINEKDIAKFRVTNILPGASVLVLEANKHKYNSNDDYSYGTVATAWIDSVSLHEDKFSIKKKNGMLTLRNNTESTYAKIYVYYKYAQVGGAYLGGITYRVPFENVAPNIAIESVANHFNKANSRIIDIQIVE